MPILFNEDDHFDFDKPENNFVGGTSEHASWGYFDPGKTNYRDGYQSPPVNWGNQHRAKTGVLREAQGDHGELIPNPRPTDTRKNGDTQKWGHTARKNGDVQNIDSCHSP